jgi:hypothetical protein
MSEILEFVEDILDIELNKYQKEWLKMVGSEQLKINTKRMTGDRREYYKWTKIWAKLREKLG